MSIQLKGGYTSEDPRLDRVPQFDERSRAYAAVDHPLVAGRAPRSYTWSVGAWLDQGQEGACVGFGVTHEAVARPAVVRDVSDDIARQVYRRAQQIDEWPGEAYSGTSVLAGIKAGRERGWYSEFRWAFGEDDLALTVGRLGPAVLGVPWYEGMYKPDEFGFLVPRGRVMGGHAILCYGLSLKGDYYKLHNSWGRTWGRDGMALISREHMRLLLSQQGEACIPVIRHR